MERDIINGNMVNNGESQTPQQKGQPRRRRLGGSAREEMRRRARVDRLARTREAVEERARQIAGQQTTENQEPLPRRERRQISFKEILLEMQSSDEPMEDRSGRLRAEIESRINVGGLDPYLVLSAGKDLEEVKKALRDEDRAEFSQLVPDDLEERLRAESVRINDFFEDLTRSRNMPRTTLKSMVGDLDRVTQNELGGMRSGWRYIEQATENLRDTSISRRDVKGYEGLRSWYAFKQAESLIEAQDIFEKTQVQADPIANIETVEIVSRFFEKSKTPENFSLARESLNRLLQAIELSKDERVSAATKERIRKRLESFELVNSLLIRMDQTEGDPDEMLKVARNFTDETWFYFYDRFASEDLKDENGREYMVDQNGNVMNVNILSEAQNAFAYQYLVDRYRVNQVQKLLKTNLDIGRALSAEGKYQDEARIIERLVRGVPGLEGFNIGDLAGDPTLRRTVEENIQSLWQEDDARKKAVRSWYDEETLLGADGFDGEEKRRRIDIKQDEVMRDVLRERLERVGMDMQRIADLEADVDLMGAVKRNGYDLAKYVFADSVDKLEYFDTKGQHTETMFGEETPYSARVVTSFMDFAISESQGDERVNKVVLKHLQKQWDAVGPEERVATEGWLLPQNMTAVRVLMQSDGLFSADLGEHIKGLIKTEKVRKSKALGVSQVPDRDVNGYVIAEQLFQGIDPNNRSVLDGFADVNWAEQSRKMKSFDIGDMLDDRQKSSKWFMGEFRTWLNHPTDKEFFEMTQKYYSMRNVRKHPGTADYLEMQWEVGQNWKEWFSYEDDITNAVFEGYVEQAKELNLIDKERGDALKARTLGREPIQSLRQIKQMVTKSFRTTVGEPGWWGGAVADLIRTLIRYLINSK